MLRLIRGLLVVGMAAVLAVPSPGTGGAGDWPFSALPEDALAYVEIPRAAQTFTDVDNFAARVLGMPMTNLAQGFLASMMGGHQLMSAEWNRPAGVVLMRRPVGVLAIGLLPVAGESQLLADFKDPVTGETVLEKTEEGYALPHPTLPGQKVHLAFAGKYVVFGDVAATVKAMAEHAAAHPQLFTRQCPIDGDVVLHLPVARVWSFYQRDIEALLDNLQSTMMFAMQMQPTPQGRMAQEILKAELDAAMGMVRQLEGMALALDLAGDHLRFTKRLTPKADTPLAGFVAANPGADSLPFSGAIPPDSIMALTGRLNMASLQPMMDFVNQKIMPLVMPASPEETARLIAAAEGMMKHYNGEFMTAYRLSSDPSAGMMGMQFEQVIGMTDAKAGFDFFQEHMATLGSLQMGMPDGGMMNTEFQSLGSADGVYSYRVVVNASGNPEMEAMTQAMYGDGMEFHLVSAKGSLVMSTDKSMARQVASRVDAGGTAAFHPRESVGPARKLGMARFSVLGVLQMAQKMAEATGQPAPFAAPVGGGGDGVLMAVGAENGELQSDLVVPFSEVTGVIQAVQGIMGAMQPPPQSTY